MGASRKVPTLRTLTELFEHGVSSPRERHLLWRDESKTWRALSTADVRRTVGDLASALRARGGAHGDRVAILSRNSPRWALADYGILAAGMATVPLYSTQSPEQVRFILDDSGARLLFVEDLAQLDRVALLLPPGLAVALMSDEEPPAGRLSWRAILDQGAGAAGAKALVGPDDLASIIYTSGTTGRPKGVLLTHRNLVSNALGCAEAIDLTQTEQLNLSILPLCHIFQRLVDYLLFASHATMAYCPNPLEAVEYLGQVQPTFFASVPRLFEKVRSGFLGKLGPGWRGSLATWAVGVGRERFHAWYRSGACDGTVGPLLALRHAIADRLVLRKIRAVFGGRVTTCFSGGAALPLEVHEFFCAAGLPLLPGYGLTEASPVLCTNRPDSMKLGSVGPALPGVELDVAADGELLARGPNIMKGYFNLPQDTAETLVEGWLHTGDLARIDELGFVFITGRKKELIVLTTGKKVPPALVEGHLAKSPFVAQVVAVGDERKFIGALVWPNVDALAAEAKRRGWAVTSGPELLRLPEVKRLLLESFDEACRDLSEFERVKNIALLPRDLTMADGELTPTLKVKRKVVLEKWKSLVEEIYAPRTPP